jgi:hypothetical protein
MVDKAVTVVKSAVQQYLDSFLNPNGINRQFLTSSVSSVGLQFVTELTYDDQMKVSPNLRKTYLARFFAENIGRLPSILIIDTGIELLDGGLNDLVEARMHYDGSWEGHLLSHMRISLSITCATLSEEDTSALSTMISMMFIPLATIVNNAIIRDEENSCWEVRLPLTGVAIGQASAVTLEGDTKTTVWTRSIDLACEFEATIGIKQPPYTIAFPPTAIVGQNGKPLPTFYNLIPNQEISLGMPYRLLVEGMLQQYYLGVSDPSIALVTSEPPYSLQPKAQGKALLLVIDRFVDADLKNSIVKSPSYVMAIPFIVTR